VTAAIILDTETTGTDNPEVLELAHSPPIADPGELYEPRAGLQLKRFRVSIPISLGAMATHHIIPEDLVDCQLWPGKWTPPEGVTYLIGHNVDFDWKAIGSPHVARICTLALARSIWPDLDSHRLGALVYYLMPREVARQRLQRAHSADQDVQLCHFLLLELLKFLPGIMSWDQLWKASEVARIPKRLSFGKYGPASEWARTTGQPGMLCGDVKRADPGYYRWLMQSCDQVRDDPYLQKALRGEAA